MYSMVMMMAVATSGDAASFGGKKASCQGSAPVASCYGSSASCYGSTSGHNSGGGLFSKMKGRGGKHNRGNSCQGSAPVAVSECATCESAPVAAPCATTTVVDGHMVATPCATAGAPIIISPMAVEPKVMPKAEEPKAEPKKVEPKKTETKKES